jgi:Delta24-sterol reductase
MTKTSHLFEHILTHYRGLFVTLVLLPVSVLYSAYTGVRNLIVFHRRSAPLKHEQRVQKVIRQIEDWKKDGGLEKLCTARSGWKTMSEMVPKYKLSHRKIDVSLYFKRASFRLFQKTIGTSWSLEFAC